MFAESVNPIMEFHAGTQAYITDLGEKICIIMASYHHYYSYA